MATKKRQKTKTRQGCGTQDKHNNKILDKETESTI